VLPVLKDHIITEWFGLEETFKDHIVPTSLAMGRDRFHWIRLLKTPSNLILNTFKDGASTASLGNLFLCLTTLTVKKFNLNLPFFSLRLFSLVLSLQALVKSVSLSFL